jgi:hypothetical protein
MRFGKNHFRFPAGRKIDEKIRDFKKRNTVTLTVKYETIHDLFLPPLLTTHYVSSCHHRNHRSGVQSTTS